MALKANYQGIKKVKRPLDLTTEGTLSAKVANSIEDEDTSALIPLSIAQMLASNIGIVNTKKADITAVGDDESGRTTASRAYKKGEYFYKDGQNCRAKTDVASGATWTLDTNYEVKPIDSAISVIEGTVTPYTGITLNDTTKLKKQGNIVVLSLFGSGVTTTGTGSASAKNIGFVPADFKPQATVVGVGTTNEADKFFRVYIDPNNGNIGIVSNTLLTNETFRVNLTFFVE